jgi:hypothetical protein
VFDVTCCQEGDVGAIVPSAGCLSTQLSWSYIARDVASPRVFNVSTILCARMPRSEQVDVHNQVEREDAPGGSPGASSIAQSVKLASTISDLAVALRVCSSVTCPRQDSNLHP